MCLNRLNIIMKMNVADAVVPFKGVGVDSFEIRMDDGNRNADEWCSPSQIDEDVFRETWWAMKGHGGGALLFFSEWCGSPLNQERPTSGDVSALGQTRSNLLVKSRISLQPGLLLSKQ